MRASFLLLLLLVGGCDDSSEGAGAAGASQAGSSQGGSSQGGSSQAGAGQAQGGQAQGGQAQGGSAQGGQAQGGQAQGGQAQGGQAQAGSAQAGAGGEGQGGAVGGGAGGGSGGAAAACKAVGGPRPDLGEQSDDPAFAGGGACEGRTLGQVLDALHAAYPDTAPFVLDQGGFSNERQIKAGRMPSGGFRLVLIQGSGDCPSGCTYFTFRYFETDAACAPMQVGSFAPPTEAPATCPGGDGAPLWGVPSPCQMGWCAPPVMTGTYAVRLEGQVLPCSLPADSKPSDVAVCAQMAVAVHPDDPMMGWVTFSSTGVPEIEGLSMPISLGFGAFSFSYQKDNLPTSSCIDSLSVSGNMQMCMASGQLSIEVVKGIEPACADYCKGGGSFTVSLSE